MKRQKTSTINEEFNIYHIEDEYRPSNDIFNEDDIIIDKIKKVLWNVLDDTERRIIICYAHLGNIRDCAKLFKVSPTTIWSQIRSIKIKIMKYL